MYLTMRSTFLLSLLTVIQTFDIRRKQDSKNHQEITRIAILQATAKFCLETVRGFAMPQALNTQTLATACGKKEHEDLLKNAIRVICYHNVKTDLAHALSPEHHFDNEKFKDGKKLITDGISKIVEHVESQRFDEARKTLGKILHTLQDFYSHSNWIELGNTSPYTALIDPNEELQNIAAGAEKTCEENCQNNHCGAKILQDILQKKILTSGYFRFIGTIGSGKPEGKCSHGGHIDSTNGITRSWDGINKDSSGSSHGSDHMKAADVAIEASVELLENIRNKNPDGFLRLVWLHKNNIKGHLKALMFSAFKDRYPDASKTSDDIVQID